MKTIFYNLIILLVLLVLGESIFGYWFTKDNFGIYMKSERDKNWKTSSTFYNKEYSFSTKGIFMVLEVTNLIQKMLKSYLKVVAPAIKDLLLKI